MKQTNGNFQVVVGWIALSYSVWLAGSPPVLAGEVEEHLAVIAAAGSPGVSNAEVRAARDELPKHGMAILPQLLEAMDTPNIVAANWARTVYEQLIAAEQSKEHSELPLDVLRDYVRNPERHGRARRTVLGLLDEVEPEFGKALLPTLLDDPEFYREAFDLAIAAGDQAKKTNDTQTAAQHYRDALAGARDEGQVIKAADRLKALGETVSVVERLGLVTRWYLIGPFDAPGMKGFAQVFPPEMEADLEATYSAKGGGRAAWTVHETADRLGRLDLNRAIRVSEEVVGYAYAEVHSPRDQQVELRCGADDNISVWINGRKAFARQQWLNGNRFDRFTAPVTLAEGTNRILVKICQGPHHKNPAVPNNWSFQLRFCDEKGAAVGVKMTAPAVDGTNSTR